jgi:DNA (cytosine-5)-methyltransferase 1
MKPRLLDLFCGAGGAAKGYEEAGFDVVGVDIAPQPRYPFRFLQGDAIVFLKDLLGDRLPMLPPIAAIHASPPCPRHSSLTGWGASRRVSRPAPELIEQTRRLLVATGLPYVIENVVGSPLLNPIQICGQGLGLKVRRHRLFESNVAMMAVACWHPGPPVIVVSGSIGRKVFDPRRKAIAPSLEQAKEVMEMPWAQTASEVCNAIPPAYTEHIGHFLKAAVEDRKLTVA